MIYDCSAPRKPEGSDINSHNNPDTRLRFPFSMSTPNDIVRTIFDHGEQAQLSVLRADLSDAYKNLAVTRSVLHKQTIKLAGVYFIDARLLFGVSENLTFTFQYLMLPHTGQPLRPPIRPVS